MKTKLAVLCSLIFCALAAAPRAARAEVISASAGKFRVEVTIDLPATPNEVYDAVTGDISPWWDHSFHQHPKKLFIEAKPGGGFWEIFDDSGDGVLHATVNYTERGKILRYTGPLGFSGIAAEFVTTYQFSPAGTGTHFKVTAVAAGDVDEKTAAIVDQVWHHFLYERLKPYIESGDYKKHIAATQDSHPAAITDISH
jgi:uncharacterized protein YndB with AHSA1/START domain